MSFYQFVDWGSEGVEYSYSLKNEDNARVEKCYMDSNSLCALEKLISGGITNRKDLQSCETALKGLIFHDSVDLLQPSVQIQKHSEGRKPFVTFVPEKKEIEFDGIKEILKNSNCSQHVCMVEALFTFDTKEYEEKYIYQQECRRQEAIKEEERRESLDKDSGIKKLFWMNMSRGRLVYASQDLDGYFVDVFRKSDKLLKIFLDKIPITGLAAYISDDAYTKFFNKVTQHNPKKFFAKIEKDMGDVSELLNYTLNIPVHPFLAIVLDRASSRNQISSEIIALREEFAQAREQLWRHFLLMPTVFLLISSFSEEY